MVSPASAKARDFFYIKPRRYRRRGLKNKTAALLGGGRLCILNCIAISQR